MAERLLNVAAMIIVVICSTAVVNLYANRDAGALLAVKQKEIIDHYHDQNMTYRDVVRELNLYLKEAREDRAELEQRVMEQSAAIAALQSGGILIDVE